MRQLPAASGQLNLLSPVTSVTAFDIPSAHLGITIFLITTNILIQRGRDTLQASRGSCKVKTGNWQLATDN
jgi:hypothetical protein